MYTISVESGFSAVHRLRLPDGTVEPLHGHDWTVRAFLKRASLDDYGMVADFTELQAALNAVARSLHHTNLAETEALARANPTAEVVARYVFDQLRGVGYTDLNRVEVSEAPGCTATYNVPDSSPSTDPRD